MMNQNHSNKRVMNRERKILIRELTEGRELARLLGNHLNPSSSSPETRDFLLQKLLSSYEKSLSLLLHNSSNNNNNLLESLCSSFPANASATSPGSEVSDHQASKDAHRKRKTSPRWTEQVKVSSGTGVEGAVDDGFCWRKYGQKGILGSHFPRGYYRCTHRHAQGCLATKQVQRSDAEPSIFEVTYRGRHTCSQNSHSPALPSTSSTRQVPNATDQKKNQRRHCEEESDQVNDLETPINFGTGLRVKTEDYSHTTETIFHSFSFPRDSVMGRENVEENLFLDDNMMENDFLGSFSPTFISPATSESNYFSVSPSHLNNLAIGQNVQTPESGLTADIISTPTSINNSPFGDFDFSLAAEDLDPDFQFEDLDSCFEAIK